MNRDLNIDKLLAEHPVMESLVATADSANLRIGYGRIEGYVKRVFDFLCASVGLIVLSPLFLLVAVIIKLDSKGPVFFRHERVGWHGRLFKIHKFRSMYVEQTPNDLHITAANDPRITKVGHFIRKWKIDELAQLIDIWCGTMSLVGPRPLAPAQIEYFSENEKNIVLSLKPGMTDLASVYFCNESIFYKNSEDHERVLKIIVLPKKKELQVKHSYSCSFWSDLKIIFKTLVVVFK